MLETKIRWTKRSSKKYECCSGVVGQDVKWSLSLCDILLTDGQTWATGKQLDRISIDFSTMFFSPPESRRKDNEATTKDPSRLLASESFYFPSDCKRWRTFFLTWEEWGCYRQRSCLFLFFCHFKRGKEDREREKNSATNDLSFVNISSKALQMSSHSPILSLWDVKKKKKKRKKILQNIHHSTLARSHVWQIRH